MSLAIHTAGDPLRLSTAVQQLVRSLDPDQPVYRIRTLHYLVSESMARRRLSMFLLATFAGLALLLAALGIYGVVSYSVAQRWHEVGIRMALGARSLDVIGMVLGQSLAPVLGGIAAGVASSLILTRFLKSLLFEVNAADPATYVVVAVVLCVVALVASFIPAYRATTVDPVNALREE